MIDRRKITLSKSDKPLMRTRKYPAANNNSIVSSHLAFCSGSSRTSNYLEKSLAKNILFIKSKTPFLA
jgi:hypothetical protein